MIRPADTGDLRTILEMCREFWTYTSYREPFDDTYAWHCIGMSHSSGLLIVLELEGKVEGFIAGIAIPLLGNGNVTQVTELAYWINQPRRGRYGVALLSGLEKAAANAGAKYVNMISMESCSPDVADKIYQERGYELIETTWRKSLEGG